MLVYRGYIELQIISGVRQGIDIFTGAEHVWNITKWNKFHTPSKDIEFSMVFKSAMLHAIHNVTSQSLVIFTLKKNPTVDILSVLKQQHMKI